MAQNRTLISQFARSAGRHALRRGFESYEIAFSPLQPGTLKETVVFHDLSNAVQFVRAYMSDHQNLTVMRRIIRELLPQRDVYRLNDYQVIEHFARLLAARRVFVSPNHRSSWGAGRAGGQLAGETGRKSKTDSDIEPTFAKQTPAEETAPLFTAAMIEEQKVVEALSVYDEESSGNRHYHEPTGLIEIVQTETTDTVVIHYVGPKPQDRVKFYRNGSLLRKPSSEPRAGGSLYNFDVGYQPKTDPYLFRPGNMFRSLFTKMCSPSRFTVYGLNRTIRIDAYNPDQWKLSLNLPPFRKVSMGAQLDNKETAHVQAGPQSVAAESYSRSEFQLSVKDTGWRRTESLDVSEKYETYSAALATPNLYAYESGEKYELSAEYESKKTDLGKNNWISLERNGQTLGIDMLDLIGGVISIVSKFSKAIKDFKDFAPQIGWYIDFEIAVLEGSVNLVWGWREANDYRAYYYTGLDLSLDIFKIVFEVGFGVMVAKIGGQICVQIKGGIALKAGPIETVAPGADSLHLGELKGDIGAGGYVRVGAGDLIKIEGGIDSTVSLAVGLDLKIAGGIEASGKSTWDGVRVTLTAKTSFGWSKKKDYTLIESQSLGSFQFPDDKKYKPSEFKSVVEVSNEVEKVVRDGFNLRVFPASDTPSFAGLGGDEIPEENVADLIAQRLWKNRDTITLDKRTTNGLAQSVRKKCDIIARKKWARDWMTREQLTQYLDSAEFAEILDKAVDPAKAYIAGDTG